MLATMAKVITNLFWSLIFFCIPGEVDTLIETIQPKSDDLLQMLKKQIKHEPRGFRLRMDSNKKTEYK